MACPFFVPAMAAETASTRLSLRPFRTGPCAGERRVQDEGQHRLERRNHTIIICRG